MFKSLLGLLIIEFPYSDHQDSYNLKDSEDIVHNFLSLTYKCVPSGNKIQAKCVFSIQNFQPASAENMVEITDSTTWLMDAFDFQYINEYAYLNLRQEIKKRLISCWFLTEKTTRIFFIWFPMRFTIWGQKNHRSDDDKELATDLVKNLFQKLSALKINWC